ncbi:MAG: class I SAM-dependent methyltransferase [Parasphingopyxis sp.]|nr:TPMT family class I SAM-dependent methyltransferase [Sphingomonadales bacterium]
MPAGDADSTRRNWRDRWADPGFAPHWRSDAMDEPVRRAVEDGFFARGSSVLDIGCGSGEVAAFLADQGLRATGIDHAEPAIDRALARFGDRDGLAFRVADFCVEAGDIGRFDAALDRGCLHSLPPAIKPDYVRALCALLPPEGGFLLLHKTHKTDPARERLAVGDVRAGIEGLFSDAFETLSVEDMQFGSGSDPMPGLAFRMRRRQSPG